VTGIVGTSVKVIKGVIVGSTVFVTVGSIVGEGVYVKVGMKVAASVGVGVGVGITVDVLVDVKVGDGVTVGVLVAVMVAVFVAVLVGVRVGAWVGVAVGGIRVRLPPPGHQDVEDGVEVRLGSVSGVSEPIPPIRSLVAEGKITVRWALRVGDGKKVGVRRVTTISV
jgi:hypothetical protein